MRADKHFVDTMKDRGNTGIRNKGSRHGSRLLGAASKAWSRQVISELAPLLPRAPLTGKDMNTVLLHNMAAMKAMDESKERGVQNKCLGSTQTTVLTALAIDPIHR